jgi:hypothetical protein
MSPNFSIDTDPQQQEAASPQMLVVRSSLRYSAGRSYWRAKLSCDWLRTA